MINPSYWYSQGGWACARRHGNFSKRSKKIKMQTAHKSLTRHFGSVKDIHFGTQGRGGLAKGTFTSFIPRHRCTCKRSCCHAGPERTHGHHWTVIWRYFFCLIHHPGPKITKDGVTVAKSIVLEDKLENLGIQRFCFTHHRCTPGSRCGKQDKRSRRRWNHHCHCSYPRYIRRGQQECRRWCQSNGLEKRRTTCRGQCGQVSQRQLSSNHYKWGDCSGTSALFTLVGGYYQC